MLRSIGLDASSTSIGWVYIEDGKPRWVGTSTLKGDITQRIVAAYVLTNQLIDGWGGVSLVKLESPAFRFKGSGIPQVRVSGAIILACTQRGIACEEVTPTAAKKALQGSGKADKEAMLKAAAQQLGYDITQLEFIAQRKDLWVARQDGNVVLTEHAADAVGVGLGVGTPIK